jgi:peptide/nickel transport system substrate-binding protein
MFSNLIRFDNTKSSLSPADLKPDLAERWETSSDGLTYTFFLRKNVKWHDGSAFTADDVVYSIEKMMDKERAAAPIVAPEYKNVQKIDDFTVKINLTAPAPAFLPQLAYGYTFIQAKKTASVDYKTTDFLMGTGPFKYKTSVSGSYMEMVKNPDYFVPGLPYLDGIRIDIVADRTAQVNALVTKNLDQTNPSYGLTNMEMINQVKQQAPTVVQRWVIYPNGSPLFLNHSYEPLKDVRVRRAMAMVIDMDQAVLGGFGDVRFRDSSHAIFSADWGMSKADIDKAIGRDKPMADRIAAAKQLMKDAGYEKGFPLTMTVQNIPENVKVLQVLADQLKAINIEGKLQPLDAATVVQQVAKGDFNAYSGNLPSMLGDPNDVMVVFRTGGSANTSKYSNPKIDALFDQQAKELDTAKRKAIVQQIEKMLLEDAVCIPDGVSSMVVASWPWVKGFVPSGSPYGGHLQMEKIWLDK